MLGFNGKELENVKLGAKQVIQIFLNGKEIWANDTKAYDLGWGTSFNVKNIIYNKGTEYYNSINWDNITADNFFILSANSASDKWSGTTADVGDNWIHKDSGVEKSYDSSNGTLIFRLYVEEHNHTTSNGGNPSYASIHVIFVPEPSKLLEVSSKDYSNISKCSNVTSDSFIMAMGARSTSSVSSALGGYYVEGKRIYISLAKSYSNGSAPTMYISAHNNNFFGTIYVLKDRTKVI